MADNPIPFDSAVFDRLLGKRIIVLGTEVNDESANRICGQLILLAAEDSEKDISFWINSPGGAVHAGLAIYDTMKFIKNDVSTVVMGMAASMGQFLLSAGTPGKRYALPHSRVMMHQPSGGIGGTAADIAIQAEQMLFTKKTIQRLIAEHTGQTNEQIELDSDRDRWFTAPEALEYGFVDRVVEGAEQLALS
ncbi:ATP-dependent Clp protease proteolytic subunit [Dactylosporangium sp. NPDC051541]|uniref:ATP-dependent Clp protease proteolytic subunit n=1 Tax=Dactylosporangium sp. NPDC051541 TaxID=3363977 RepID=UPI0037B292E7